MMMGVVVETEDDHCHRMKSIIDDLHRIQRCKDEVISQFDEKLQILAKMSLMVYRKKNVDDKYSLIKCGEAAYDLKLGIYQSNTQSEVKILAIGGTEDLTHLFVSYKLFIPGQSIFSNREGWSYLREIITDIIHFCGSYEITAVTGHSMGGYFAETLSSHTNLPGAGFSCPGVWLDYSGASTHENFRVILAETDILGNIYRNHHLGKITEVKGLHSHQIIDMIHGLADYWTVQNVPELIETIDPFPAERTIESITIPCVLI